MDLDRILEFFQFWLLLLIFAAVGFIVAMIGISLLCYLAATFCKGVAVMAFVVVLTGLLALKMALDEG
jgi:hypothetical protein